MGKKKNNMDQSSIIVDKQKKEGPSMQLQQNEQREDEHPLSQHDQQLQYTKSVLSDMKMPFSSDIDENSLSDRRVGQPIKNMGIDFIIDNLYNSNERPVNHQQVYKDIEAFIQRAKLLPQMKESLLGQEFEKKDRSQLFKNRHWIWQGANPPVICEICNRTVRYANYSNKHFMKCLDRNAKAYYIDLKKHVDHNREKADFAKTDKYAVDVIMGLQALLNTVIPWSFYSKILEQKQREYGLSRTILVNDKEANRWKYIFRVDKPMEVTVEEMLTKLKDLRQCQLIQNSKLKKVDRYQDADQLLKKAQMDLFKLKDINDLTLGDLKHFLNSSRKYFNINEKVNINQYYGKNLFLPKNYWNDLPSFSGLTPKQLFELFVRATNTELRLDNAKLITHNICAKLLQYVGEQNLNVKKFNKESGSKLQQQKLRHQEYNDEKGTHGLFEHQVYRFMVDIVESCHHEIPKEGIPDILAPFKRTDIGLFIKRAIDFGRMGDSFSLDYSPYTIAAQYQELSSYKNPIYPSSQEVHPSNPFDLQMDDIIPRPSSVNAISMLNHQDDQLINVEGSQHPMQQYQNVEQVQDQVQIQQEEQQPILDSVQQIQQDDEVVVNDDQELQQLGKADDNEVVVDLSQGSNQKDNALVSQPVIDDEKPQVRSQVEVIESEEELSQQMEFNQRKFPYSEEVKNKRQIQQASSLDESGHTWTSGTGLAHDGGTQMSRSLMNSHQLQYGQSLLYSSPQINQIQSQQCFDKSIKKRVHSKQKSKTLQESIIKNTPEQFHKSMKKHQKANTDHLQKYSQRQSQDKKQRCSKKMRETLEKQKYDRDTKLQLHQVSKLLVLRRLEKEQQRANNQLPAYYERETQRQSLLMKRIKSRVDEQSDSIAAEESAMKRQKLNDGQEIVISLPQSDNSSLKQRRQMYLIKGVHLNSRSLARLGNQQKQISAAQEAIVIKDTISENSLIE